MLVECVVRGARPCTDVDAGVDYEALNGTKACFYAAPPVTLAQVETLFPFEGRFHFRQRVSGKSIGLRGVECVWLDLVDKRKELLGPIPGQECIEILALALDIPNVGEDESRQDIQQYLEEVAQEMPALALADRPRRQAVEPAQKKGVTAHVDKLKQGAASVMKHISMAAQKTTHNAHNLSIDSVTSGVSNLWNSFAKQTRDIFTGSALSDLAEGNLAELSDLLGTSLAPATHPEHLGLLRDLWQSLFPRESQALFSPRSDKWKEAGFQAADPTGDLKNTGILAVRAMIHMGLAYPEKTQEALRANKVNTKTKYPFAVVCVNITLLLAELLNLRDNKYMSSQAGYWTMFEEPEAFFEMFCICFFHMDVTWVARKAVRADFGKLIGEIKGHASNTLNRNPTSIMDFKMISIDEGMTS